MSRGFVKEDDQEEKPIIPQRAPLPPGVTNYVTEAGMQALLNEKAELEQERQELPESKDSERRIAVNVINTKLNMLNERINSALVVEPRTGEKEIRFGTKVKLKFPTQKMTRSFQIVGVDEADVKSGKIAFTSPIAKCIMGKQKGDIAELELGKEKRKIEILDILPVA